jgi:hypothetical protein
MRVMAWKYIILDNGLNDSPIIFPDYLEHGDVAQAFKAIWPNCEIASAGLIDEIHASEPHGGSVGLSLQMHPHDIILINKARLTEPHLYRPGDKHES